MADQLGTPRMVFDKTGSLATTKRHDYLPFGEELFAGVGGRITTLGYTGDTIRQKFTSKERDNETGLDYFLARYYSSTQGRFASPDRPLADQNADDPQTWNLYEYVRNNPPIYTDPLGLWHWVEPNNNGNRFLQWDEGDDEYSLSRFLEEQTGVYYYPSDLRGAYLPSGGDFGADTIVDITGAPRGFTNTRGVENVSIDLFMNITPTGRGAKAAGGFFSWIAKGAKRLFGRKTATESAEAALKLTVGARTTVNASQLRSVSRHSLDSGKLQDLRGQAGRPALENPSGTLEGAVKVTPDGVIVSGHHRARVWAEQGKKIEVEVVPTPPGYNVGASKGILDLPIR